MNMGERCRVVMKRLRVMAAAQRLDLICLMRIDGMLWQGGKAPLGYCH